MIKMNNPKNQPVFKNQLLNGWRKTLLYIIVLILLISISVNLYLTLWILKAISLSVSTFIEVLKNI